MSVLANVSTTNTFYEWMVRTNQLIVKSNETESSVNSAYDASNSAATRASSSFDKANSANVLAYNTGIGSNAFATAIGIAGNSYFSNTLSGANGVSSAAYDKANAANILAASSNTIAYAAFGASNGVSAIAIAAYDKANAANILAASSNTIAYAAFAVANAANSQSSSSALSLGIAYAVTRGIIFV